MAFTLQGAITQIILLHDYATGKIAWFCHRTKQGKGHNWEGTTGAAEGDMFDEVIGKAKTAGFTISD